MLATTLLLTVVHPVLLAGGGFCNGRLGSKRGSNSLLLMDCDKAKNMNAAIRERDESFWFGEGNPPTCRAVVEHARLMDAADLGFPIILSSDGRVMDGMHRVAKAALLSRPTIEAVQFTSDPEPDYVGVHPDELPYD